jgi:hypothetical protein
MLGIGHESGLMVCGGIDGADSVHACWETAGYIGAESVVCGNVVESLKEGKGGRVERLGSLKRGELLNDDVAMADHDSIPVDLLGSSVVVGLGIDEVTCETSQIKRESKRGGGKLTRLHVDDLHLDNESRVLHEALVAVLGEHKLAAWCLVEADDATHLQIACTSDSAIFTMKRTRSHRGLVA